MSLPGVKVGPLDPDSTETFGSVAGQSTARQLLRLHKQMYGPGLRLALVRPRDDERSKAVLDHLDEVQAYAERVRDGNGDPVLPTGARVVGAAVRGDLATGRVLTFNYRIASSGRVGKWYAPYRQEDLPESFEAGEAYVRVRQMKDRGVVAFDEGATHKEILERHNRELQREVRSLRTVVEGSAAVPVTDGETTAPDLRDEANLAEDNERLRRENAEMMERLTRLESVMSAQPGGVPLGGLDEHPIPAEGEQPDSAEEPGAADPPFDGFEGMRADELSARLRSDDSSQEERQAVLDYERTHANRKSVVAAAEESLTRNA